jgi:hypothetical protein
MTRHVSVSHYWRPRKAMCKLGVFTIYRDGKPGNSDRKNKWYVSFRLESFGKLDLPIEIILFSRSFGFSGRHVYHLRFPLFSVGRRANHFSEVKTKQRRCSTAVLFTVVSTFHSELGKRFTNHFPRFLRIENRLPLTNFQPDLSRLM